MRTVVFHLYYKHIVTKMEGVCSLDAYGERVQGLPPKVSYHQKESKLPPDFPELLEEATALRRECHPTVSMISSESWNWRKK